jgi:hypothetical protein
MCLNLLEPSGSIQACTAIPLPLHYLLIACSQPRRCFQLAYSNTVPVSLRITLLEPLLNFGRIDLFLNTPIFYAVCNLRRHVPVHEAPFHKFFFTLSKYYLHTICNGPTNALVCNKTLIQMLHIKTLKITPTCFDHQMIIIGEPFDPG